MRSLAGPEWSLRGSWREDFRGLPQVPSSGFTKFEERVQCLLSFRQTSRMAKNSSCGHQELRLRLQLIPERTWGKPSLPVAGRGQLVPCCRREVTTCQGRPEADLCRRPRSSSALLPPLPTASGSHATARCP